MWPSEIVASHVYDIANWFLIGGAAITVIATILVVWMGNVKEVYLRTDLARTALAAADANEKAERERLARVKIEARIAPRLLTQAQQNELTAILSGLPKQHGFVIASPSTPESEWFARILTAPLTAAGWKMEILPGTATATVLQPTGVVVQYAIDPRAPFLEDSKESKAARRLADALKAIGIGATAVPGLMSAPQTIQITISAR